MANYFISNANVSPKSQDGGCLDYPGASENGAKEAFCGYFSLHVWQLAPFKSHLLCR